jgi:putative NADPH-quinone reductase
VRFLVVYGHPVPGSFSAAVLDRLVVALEAESHQVDLIDLYADHFDPVLAEAQRQAVFDPDTADPVVADHVRRLLAAQGLVLVYPTWWGGLPAMVKGWLDRVLVLGAAYDLVPGRNRVTGRLRNIRRLAAVTSHGSSKLVNVVQGEPGKLLVTRQLRALCHWRCRTTWLAHYEDDRAGDEERRAFLDRVEIVARRW